jgi:hypothetical protein
MPKTRKAYHTRLYDREFKTRQRLSGYSSVMKGTATERYVERIMRDFRGIDNLEVIGAIGGMFDIIYRYPDDYNDYKRALQVKTLVKNHHANDTWSVTFEAEYPPDTLIVLVNEERTRFGLISYGAIRVKTLSLGFSKMNRGKYRHNKYKNLEDFSRSLFRRSKISTRYIFEKSLSGSILKEYNSLERLEEKCNELNLIFNRNSINCNVVDCYINNQTVQCKYGSYSGGSSHRFNLRKSNGKVDGVHRVRPYSSNDPLKYFIFEIGGKYKGQFCIIPKKVLDDYGYLSSDVQKGKTFINISVPDSDRDHWCLEYWNNFNPIREEKQIFIVESITDSRSDDNGNEFLVRWEGFNFDDSTWEPEKGIRHTNAYKKWVMNGGS